MATIEAGRGRIVGLAVALFAVWIGVAACAKKEQAPEALLSADLKVASMTTPDSLTALQPPPTGCFHYDGSEYRCPMSKATTDEQRTLMLASGTQILEGSLRIRTPEGVTTIELPRGTKLDAIFLTPRGLKLLEDHYRFDQSKRSEHARRADSLSTFIASFKEP